MIVKQETKQKRNETNQAETKRNETQQKRNETNKIIKKNKNKQTLTKRFLLHETTIHKMPVTD